MYATSSPTLQITTDLLKAPFDASTISIPSFMVAGTKKYDASDGKNSGICPLVELQEKYNCIASTEKIIARRVNTDHGDMLSYAHGYMTAWFMYYLKATMKLKIFSSMKTLKFSIIQIDKMLKKNNLKLIVQFYHIIESPLQR